MIPNILAIAGSDPSGGAGIQADLKAIGANRGFGMAAITALTAQNTKGVSGVHMIPPEFVRAQIDAIYDDVRVDAVKIGMVATARIAGAVAEALRLAEARNVVLDPVMISTSGDRLLDDDAISVLTEELLPLSAVLTPNLPEAAVLLARSAPTDRAGMLEMARDLLGKDGAGPRAVLLKGGHLEGEDSPDVLATAETHLWLESARTPGRAIHGGGCTLSSALAAQLGNQKDVAAAAQLAKDYVRDAIALADALQVGEGARPLHHFFNHWSIL